MSTELTISAPQELALNFKPIFTTTEALTRYQEFKDFVSKVLREGVDYGKVPGTDRNTLLKPGAEKLCLLFGYTADYEWEVVIEEWTPEKYGQPLFYYRVKCRLFRGNFKVGEGIGSSSTWEDKHKYRWVPEAEAKRLGIDLATAVTRGGAMSEFDFAINKAETSGQYGKPAEYWARWKQAIADGTAHKVNKQKKDGTASPGYEMNATMYRVPNDQFGNLINTVQKIAQKRAYVAATLSCTNASDYFTQDMEDYVEIDPVPVVVSAPARHEPSAITPEVMPPPKAAPVIHKQQPAQTVVLPTPQHPAPHANAPGRPIPEELQGLWRQMFKPEGRVQVLDGLKERLMKAAGPEKGEAMFYDVLRDHNAEKTSDLSNSLDEARKAAKDLYFRLHPSAESVTA